MMNAYRDGYNTGYSLLYQYEGNANRAWSWAQQVLPRDPRVRNEWLAGVEAGINAAEDEMRTERVSAWQWNPMTEEQTKRYWLMVKTAREMVRGMFDQADDLFDKTLLKRAYGGELRAVHNLASEAMELARDSVSTPVPEYMQDKFWNAVGDEVYRQIERRAGGMKIYEQNPADTMAEPSYQEVQAAAQARRLGNLGVTAAGEQLLGEVNENDPRYLHVFAVRRGSSEYIGDVFDSGAVWVAYPFGWSQGHLAFTSLVEAAKFLGTYGARRHGSDPYWTNPKETYQYDDPEYRFYTILDGYILGGWEYREDAEDQRNEWREIGRAVMVLTRAGAVRRGIDPMNNAAWCAGAMT